MNKQEIYLKHNEIKISEIIKSAHIKSECTNAMPILVEDLMKQYAEYIVLLAIQNRDKAHCLDANYSKGANWEQYKKKSRRQLVGSEHSWRKLTPKECERLQTVPDDYTLVPWQKRMMSNSQRYKMLGNGWTIEVIKHIFKNL